MVCNNGILELPPTITTSIDFFSSSFNFELFIISFNDFVNLSVIDLDVSNELNSLYVKQ